MLTNCAASATITNKRPSGRFFMFIVVNNGL
jgi:hypothetical protein